MVRVVSIADASDDRDAMTRNGQLAAPLMENMLFPIAISCGGNSLPPKTICEAAFLDRECE